MSDWPSSWQIGNHCYTDLYSNFTKNKFFCFTGSLCTAKIFSYHHIRFLFVVWLKFLVKQQSTARERIHEGINRIGKLESLVNLVSIRRRVRPLLNWILRSCDSKQKFVKINTLQKFQVGSGGLEPKWRRPKCKGRMQWQLSCYQFYSNWYYQVSFLNYV